ncbi:mechanosensitive ion channel family protein [Brachybacterium hainanense]|uniref:Mechanosensitive ion channel family protein n=1 Tax=Brachybacterium hainanense TaxID=1541174 RepID=A0ABV6RIE2_9MICO
MPEFDLPLLADPSAEATLSYLDQALRWLLSNGLMIAVILVGAAIFTALARWLIHRFFRTMIASSTKLTGMAGSVAKRDRRDQAASAKRIEQRASTLSNVAVNVATLIIWLIATVMILDKIGVNIAPVIASLGVVGLAAGIGAQTIIKDIVAGVVMLFEDIIAVGDVVDLEYATGTVVNINLRVTQLRSLDGSLWTVRNGEIIRVGNMSRGYSKAVVVLDLDAGADDARVSEVLARVGEELTADPEWDDVLAGQIEVSGILSEDGARYQRRVVVTVTPGSQWATEMELRRRIREAFASEGISFALPRFADTTGASA